MRRRAGAVFSPDWIFPFAIINAKASIQPCTLMESWTGRGAERAGASPP